MAEIPADNTPVTAQPPQQTAPASAPELAWSYRVQAGLPGALTHDELHQLQLARLNETFAWARQHCPYFAGRLPARPLTCLEDLGSLPLMDESAFSQGLTSLLGVEQSAVSRIVTLPTSGTTGEPKRIAFTADEQAGIVAYLASGMRMLSDAGETVAVLYPCDHAGGLGQLICEAIEFAGRRACAYGLPKGDRGFSHLAQTCRDQQVHGLVGFPQHIFALARWCEHHGITLPVSGVLLSADNAAPALKREIERILNAQVFIHYGSTEMGYGGAVECAQGTGLHIRETDLLFEVIDPVSGTTVPPGVWGELVVTTLNRRAMPFIRYRTGDMTRLLPGLCGCGSVLQRIDLVRGHAGDDLPFTLYDLEDELFALPGVLDFAASWDAREGVRGTYKVTPSKRCHFIRPLDTPTVLDTPSAPLVNSGALTLEVQLLPGFELDSAALSAALEARTGSRVRVTYSTVDEFLPFYAAKRTIRRHIH